MFSMAAAEHYDGQTPSAKSVRKTVINPLQIFLIFSEATMSEAELNTYKLQLQQVEAALTTDPDNEVSYI